jgi:hypothetical protein
MIGNATTFENVFPKFASLGSVLSPLRSISAPLKKRPGKQRSRKKDQKAKGNAERKRAISDLLPLLYSFFTAAEHLRLAFI